MNEIELLESTVSEYRNLSESDKVKTNGELDTGRLVSILSKNHSQKITIGHIKAHMLSFAWQMNTELSCYETRLPLLSFLEKKTAIWGSNLVLSFPDSAF